MQGPPLPLKSLNLSTPAESPLSCEVMGSRNQDLAPGAIVRPAPIPNGPKVDTAPMARSSRAAVRPHHGAVLGSEGEAQRREWIVRELSKVKSAKPECHVRYESIYGTVLR